MMSKIAIVCDSTGSISPKEQEELGIYISYLSIIFGTDSYREFKDIGAEEFVKRCESSEELPTTSQPTPGTTIEMYENLLKEGYEHIVHIALSSQLSGSYQSAVNCAEMVDPERIHVIDSRTVTYTQGMFATNAARKVKEGATIEEVLAYIEMVKDNNEFYAAINDLTNLRKGGRLSNIEAKLGSLLQIKPIVHMVPDGTLQPEEKIRTFKKSLKRLVEIAKEANLTEDYQLSVMHIVNPEGAETVYNELKEIYPTLELTINDISLVVAAHGGPGAVGIGWVKKN